MGGSGDPTQQRSSSPLKRRASIMDHHEQQESGSGATTTTDAAKEDVDMINPPEEEGSHSQDHEMSGQQRDAQGGVEGEETVATATTAGPDSATTGAIVSQADLPVRTDIPPVHEQVKTIRTLVNAFKEVPPKEGDTVFLVSQQWLKKALAFGGDAKHAGKEPTVEELGPVDNADIIQTIFTDANGQECVRLKPGSGGDDFELFPRDAWDLLVAWYGLAPGQLPIVRVAHNTAPDPIGEPNIQYEFHPPTFIIHRVWSAVSPIPIEQEIKARKPPPPIIVHSSSFGFNAFLREAKERTGISMDRKVRLWRILQTLPAAEVTAPSSGMKTPPDSPQASGSAAPSVASGFPLPPGSWSEMLLDVETFLKLDKSTERDVVDCQDQTNNLNYNGKRSLAQTDLTVDQTLVLDEQIDREHFVTTFRGGAKDKSLETRGSSSSLATQARGVASGRGSPAPSGPMTRGRTQQKSGRTLGCVGLQNLGNTCYMNSALQCVRSVEELTKYFLTHEADKEINEDNPLSHNGDVARSYGKLLEEIYKDPPPGSFAPRQFKNIIGRYAPAFSGYGQQDSQEFLGFLLDGLQEDLNRIHKKPYIEKPDSTDDMINNPAAIREMAEKVWDITKKRDDSVIADLFTGLYKSTLVCPVCSKISITFDPFNNLTLPLPVANVWSRAIKYFPLNDAPVEIVVDIDRNSSIRSLKQYISARVGVPPERLFGAEEFRDKFFKFYDDFSCVSEEIQTTDHPVVFELEAVPTNHVYLNSSGGGSGGGVPIKKANKRNIFQPINDEQEEVPPWDNPMAERLLIPVIHRFNPEDSNFRRRGTRFKSEDEAPPPHFIIVTPEEARSEDIIRRKILEKVATFTTWPSLAADEETDTETSTSASTDPEMINTASDVDSGGDSKVVAKSVEGEDDMVDVTMKDANGDKKAAPPPTTEEQKQYPHLLKKFKNRRPKWLDPHEFLNPRFQNLFELSFFSDPGTMIPTGWSNVQDENYLPRFSTRQPKAAPSDVEMRSPGAWDASEESGNEGLTPAQAAATTRMAEESSEEEDSDLPEVQNIIPRTNGHHLKNNQVSARGKKKMKPTTTYGKKGKKRFERQQRERAAAMARQPQQQQHQQHAVELPDLVDGGGDGGPLIRLGEGIAVEWNEAAWCALFEGAPSRPNEGMKTYHDIPTLEDPQLEARKKQRLMRRKNGITLDDCLLEFEKEEILSEQDTWYCPRCKEHRRASKKFDLWKTPDILVVHLKRFSSSGWRRDKLDILVDFPVEGLDLTERVIDKEDGKQEIYDLIAVDDHWGGLGGGHYTAFAKNFIDGEWYEYNDTSVSKQKDLGRIVTSAAYLLFYRRRSDVPLGGPRFQEISDRYSNGSGSGNIDDSALDSGEGQRLGLGSSQRGSPSASTGAGLTLHKGGLGLASIQAGSTGSSGSMSNTADQELPSYPGSLLQAGEPGDDLAAQLPWPDQDTVHNSVEGDGEDEGISMPEYGNANPMSNMMASWNFNALRNKSNARAESDGDLDSTMAQNDNSSANDDVFDDRGDDVSMLVSDRPAGLDKSDESLADFADFGDDHDLPPPALEGEGDEAGQLAAADAWEKNGVIEVPANAGHDQASEDRVAEIHVDEGDDEPRVEQVKR